uniref:Hypothetical secreted protein n=1 Tax=Rhipicephalus sanguineus TaxID=34632 RepID=C9W1J7_RHISA
MKLINSTVLLLLSWAGFCCGTAPCAECAKIWCPGVTDTVSNTYLSGAPPDPEISDVLKNISERTQKSCPQVWCPAVQIPCLNQWIKESDEDPDLKSTTMAPTEAATEAAAEATDSEDKETTDEEKSRVTNAVYVAGAGWDLSCYDAYGIYYGDGMPCVYKYFETRPNTHKPGILSRVCTRGSCQRGRCEPIGAVLCAIY